MPRGILRFPIAPGIVGIAVPRSVAAIAPAAVMDSREVIKMLYLLHFKERICPSRSTQHYLGWTENLDQRIRQHRNGTGARLCQVAKERGIDFVVAEIIPGDRSRERQLKEIGQHNKMCPICQRSQR